MLHQVSVLTARCRCCSRHQGSGTRGPAQGRQAQHQSRPACRGNRPGSTMTSKAAQRREGCSGVVCGPRRTLWAQAALRCTTRGALCLFGLDACVSAHTGQDARAACLLVCVCVWLTLHRTAAGGLQVALTTKSVLRLSFPASMSTSAIIIWPPCRTQQHNIAGQQGTHTHKAQREARGAGCRHSMRCQDTCLTLQTWKPATSPSHTPPPHLSHHLRVELFVPGAQQGVGDVQPLAIKAAAEAAVTGSAHHTHLGCQPAAPYHTVIWHFPSLVRALISVVSQVPPSTLVQPTPT
jgi:hypothetical protein